MSPLLLPYQVCNSWPSSPTRGLHGGGAGIDANEDATGVAVEFALGDDFLVVAGFELSKILVGGKKRIQTLDLGTLCVTQGIDGLDELRERAELIGLVRHGSAARHKQVGVLGHDTVLLVHVAADGTAARQARDGLGHDGLEDGGGHVLGAGALVEQRLHVGLGKNAAAGRDGIKGMIILCVLIEAGGVCLKQGSHLVDKGTGTSGADPVHTLVDSACKVDDLRVLAAKLDGDIRPRSIVLKCGRNRYDFLDKWNM